MDLAEANNLNRDIMRLVKNMPRLKLGARITLGKDKSQDIRTDQEEQEEDHAYSVSLPHEVFAGNLGEVSECVQEMLFRRTWGLGTWKSRGLRAILGGKARNLDQWKGHPLKDLTLDELEKVVPIVVDGDETPITGRGKCGG